MLWTCPKSPKWLMIRKRWSSVQVSLQKFSKFTNTVLPKSAKELTIELDDEEKGK